MKTVKEVSEISGVSVRTLHHYDAIGLLKPSKVTKAGYRLYDSEALSLLQNILLFRELKFPLKKIKEMIYSPDFDKEEALKQQIHLLELQREHIEKLISYAYKIQREGGGQMSFDAFDKSEIERYKAEAEEKWGGTAAYREFLQKEKEKKTEEGRTSELMLIFSELGKLKKFPPSDERVQGKVRELQSFITKNYYTCTDDILYDLGQMYINDERFKNNIDKAGGEGTSEFASKAISVFYLKV